MNRVCGLKVVTRWWYYGWRFIVLGMKYVVCHLLWVVGCVCNKFDTEPWLASMSPHFSRKRWLGTKHALSVFSCDFCVCVFYRSSSSVYLG